MILTTHALTGAVIGKNLDSIPLIIALSIMLHFVMDHLRHGEYVEVFNSKTGLRSSGWKVAIDIIVALSILFSLIHFKNLDYSESRLILIGAFFSMSPDLITFIYWLFGRTRFLEGYYKFHTWVHKHPYKSPERQWTLRNAANDILISLLAMIILFAL